MVICKILWATPKHVCIFVKEPITILLKEIPHRSYQYIVSWEFSINYTHISWYFTSILILHLIILYSIQQLIRTWRSYHQQGMDVTRKFYSWKFLSNNTIEVDANLSFCLIIFIFPVWHALISWLFWKLSISKGFWILLKDHNWICVYSKQRTELWSVEQLSFQKYGIWSERNTWVFVFRVSFHEQ